MSVQELADSAREMVTTSAGADSVSLEPGARLCGAVFCSVSLDSRWFLAGSCLMRLARTRRRARSAAVGRSSRRRRLGGAVFCFVRLRLTRWLRLLARSWMLRRSMASVLVSRASRCGSVLLSGSPCEAPSGGVGGVPPPDAALREPPRGLSAQPLAPAAPDLVEPPAPPAPPVSQALSWLHSPAASSPAASALPRPKFEL